MGRMMEMQAEIEIETDRETGIEIDIETENETETENQTGREPTLEESFEELEEMISRLEAEDITLEESFRVYRKGMEILKDCNDRIDLVEKKVLKINEDGQTDEF